jgi:hypothetical protein
MLLIADAIAHVQILEVSARHQLFTERQCYYVHGYVARPIRLVNAQQSDIAGRVSQPRWRQQPVRP